MVQTNGISLRLIENGTGPAVLLCHGFPETSRSWRRQIAFLANAGYRAIAPDLRGFGGSSAPDCSSEYTQLHIVGDLVGLLDALGIGEAAIVGHDWGAIAAWNAALLRPDRFPKVAALSIPYIPRGESNLLEQLRRGAKHFYMLGMQKPETGEAMRRDVISTLKNSYFSLSGTAAAAQRFHPFAPPRPPLAVPHLPPWLDPVDFAASVSAFESSGFQGGLHWYRAIVLTFQLMGAFKDAPVRQPSLFITGDADPMYPVVRQFIDDLQKNAPGLRRSLHLPGIGHWTQQEAPEPVNHALLDFLKR